MGFLKKTYVKSKESYAKWKSEAPTRERLRIETAKRRLEMERQRAEIMKQKLVMAKAQAETRKYSQQFRQSGFGRAMSMQPSGINQPSYFAPKVVQPKVQKLKIIKRKKRRKK